MFDKRSYETKPGGSSKSVLRQLLPWAVGVVTLVREASLIRHFGRYRANGEFQMLRKVWTGRLRSLLVSASFAGVLFAARLVGGVPFSGGIVAERIGGDASFGAGNALVSGTGTAIFIDEFSRTTNARLQTIALPSTDPDADGPQHPIVETGSSANVGFMARSVDGNYLVTTGHGVDAGTTGLPGNVATINRIIARIDAAGNVNTSTGYSNDGLAAGNSTPRSTASVDGTSFWVGTANNTAGTRYIDSFGAIDSNSERMSGASSQVRTIGIFGGRFFYSVNSIMRSVKDSVTGGIPINESDGVTVTDLTGITNASSEQFVFLDRDPNVGFDGTGLDTLYLTQVNAIATTTNPTSDADLNTGGLQKYVFDGANFVQQITFNSGLVNDATNPLHGGLQGLGFAGVDSSNNPIFYASTSAPPTTGNAIVKFVDSGAASAFTLVAQSPLNSVFRGVALAPGNAPAGVAGDYNGNGTVDAADYVVWRKSNGTNTQLQNEVSGSTPGQVTQEDYDAWRARYGNTSGSGSSLGGSAVPEPSVVALIGLAVPALLFGRRRDCTK